MASVKPPSPRPYSVTCERCGLTRPTDRRPGTKRAPKLCKDCAVARANKQLWTMLRPPKAS